jgi:exopolysaccharide biosynthesis polyprenyl glycosylphosphotransferase
MDYVNVVRESSVDLGVDPGTLADRDRRARPAMRANRWTFFTLGLDATLLFAAHVLAPLGAAAAGSAFAPSLSTLLFPAVVLSLLAVNGQYRPRLKLQFLDDARRIVAAVAVGAMALITLEVLAGAMQDGTMRALRLWVFATVFLVAGRAGLVWSEVRARRAGETATPMLVVGSGRVASLLARRLASRPELGLRPVGLLVDDPAPDVDGSLPLLGALIDLEPVVEEHGIEHVVIAFTGAPDERMLTLVERCRRLGVRVSLVPRLYEAVTQRLAVEHVGGLPLLTIDRPDPLGWQFSLKYALDRVAAAAILVVGAPVLAACALGVLLSSGRPILYRQVRVGRDGVQFEMLKFRSMWVGADWKAAVEALTNGGETGPGGVEGEDRRTRYGSFLRRTCLDELPQLLNVLRGEMSLVGPRPERPDFARFFEQTVYRYGDRHRVKSGITGWAQIHGLRGKTSLAERAEWDNYYIENFSLWLDLKILMLTALAIARPARDLE